MSDGRGKLDFEAFAAAILKRYFEGGRTTNITPTEVSSPAFSAGLLSYWRDGLETDGSGPDDEVGYSSRYCRRVREREREELLLLEEEAKERAELARLKAKYETTE